MTQTVYGAPALNDDGTGYETTDDAEKSLKRVLNLVVPVYGSLEELVANLEPGFPADEVGVAEITVTVRRLSDIQQH